MTQPKPDTAVHGAPEVELLRRRLRALEEGDERFRVLCESLPVGVFLTDARGRTVYHNPRWLALTGLTQEEGLGYGWTKAVHPDDRAALLEDWRRAVASGEGPWSHRHRLQTASGAVRWVKAWAAPLRGREGELRGYVGTVEDVTEQVEAEASLRESGEQLRHVVQNMEERWGRERRLEELRRQESLAVLAGGVAHDFSNLLTGILGFATLARQEMAGEAAGRAREFLDQAVASAQRAAELCGHMLAYSGRGRFVVGPVDLSWLVRDLEAELRTLFPSNAALTLELAAEPPPVLADASQLRRLTLNLARNAAESLGDRGGAAVIRTGAAWRDADPEEDLPEGEYVFLEVADAGCGMDAETRRRAFEPFFTTKFTGRGLGLAASYGIVRGHRGAIRLTSEPGLGTTVRVWLPRAPAGGRRDEPEHPPAHAGRPTAGAVLFVDDEPALRDLAVRTLRPAGFEALTAADGRKALQLLRERGADVRAVVLDLTMPGLDAHETLRQLRQLRPDLPVILSSGYCEETAHRLVAHELAGFLQKPYRPHQLVELVRQVLPRRPG